MADNLKAVAYAAGLTPEQKRQIDILSKKESKYKELSSLPNDIAQKSFERMPVDQQEDMVKSYGETDVLEKPKPGWRSAAFKYNPLTLAFKGFVEVADATTRTYRALAIPLSQGEVGFAWDKANDKGDKVYNEGRIEKAKGLYGQDAVDIAMRIKSGESLADIAASATPEQMKYIAFADPTNKTIAGVQDVEKERALFNETLGVVDKAKFSPGRQFANLILPEALEKNKLAYSLTSGIVDTLFRFFVDPLVVSSKIRSLYVIGKYSLEAVTGGKKVAETFAMPKVAAFWDKYGAALDRYTKAQSRSPKEALAAKRELEILAPEYGPEVIRAFQRNQVTNAASARAFFENTEEAVAVLAGSVGRKRVIIPRLDRARRARVKFMTEADKVINIDKRAPSFINAMFGDMPTTDGVSKALIDGKEQIVNLVKGTGDKGTLRFSGASLGLRLDRFKAKFNIAPLFRDDRFDVTAKDASIQVYRLARVVFTKEDAKMISETFEAITDIGKRKEMFSGLWGNIAEIRGLNLTEAGQLITRRATGKDGKLFGRAGSKDSDIGAITSDFNSTMFAPSIVDIDRAAFRSGWINRAWGTANKELVDKMTGYWSFLTLAGPRYVIRNATEDLMVHLAIGGSPWGLAKSRYLSTRVNTAFEAARKSGNFTESPLGALMLFINKKESVKYQAQIAKIDADILGARKLMTAKVKELDEAVDETTKIRIRGEIDELKVTSSRSIVEETRLIMATSFTSGRVNRYRERLGLGPMFEDEAEILAEHLVYGNLDNSVSIVTESAMNFATSGADYITNSTLLARTHGVRNEKLIVEDRRAKKYKSNSNFTNVVIGPENESSMLTWLMRIGYYSNDEIGAIAVANLDNKAVAIREILEYMDNNPEFRRLAQLEARGVTDAEHAEIIYTRAREIFETKRVGKDGLKEINIELLDKIRFRNEQTGKMAISGQLGIDDLPKLFDDVPEYAIGPELIPISEAGNITASLVTHGWKWLGMGNGRISREPMVFNEIIAIRKSMKKSGMEAAYIQSVVSKVDQTNPKSVLQATERAKRQFAEIVEERAVNQILQYVDNPLVRTQLAFSIRNFSRFYRATEDFYRRAYRMVRYNPASIRKAALTYDGIAHNGFIQEDDQGEKYFVYPLLEPGYRAVQTAMTLLGVPAEFKVPMPIQFGSQVKMLTPSLNQDSIIPTFNGPLAGISIKTLTNLVDLFGAPGAADTITEYTLGKYAVDQPYLSSFLPAHLNRALAAMDKDERDSQYASAWRKAVTYLEAGGHGLKTTEDEFGNVIPPSIQEQEEYRQRIKNTTLSIIGTRFVLGFVLPATPQVQLKADMAQWISDNGNANFKQAWNNLLDKYPGDYDAAMTKWVELFPNQIPFTVTESDRKTVAVIRYAEESGVFVDKNAELFKNYPQGAAFLIPHKSGFSWDAYTTMKNMGLKYNKRVDDFLRDVQTAADLQQYYAKKNEYEVSLEESITDVERSIARDEFQEWSKVFKAGRPLVQEELAEGGKKAVERIKAINDLRNMLDDPKVTVRGPLQKQLKEMLDLYESYKADREIFSSIPGGTNISTFLKEETIVRMRELSRSNENTISAYNTLFASLLGDTSG
jgi:thioredoxin reductase